MALLAQIRPKQHDPKLRPAMPIKRSWRMILAIYAVAGSLILLFYSVRYRAYASGPMYYSAAGPAGYGFRASFPVAMPRGFGFNYRGQGVPARNLSPDAATLDWVRGEKTILEQINRINSQAATTYEPLVSPKEIEDALSRHRQDADGFSPDTLDSRLIEWNSLSLNVDGHELRRDLPMAKVSNEAVEKAVKQYIKGQVEGMLKTLQARLSPTDLPEAEGQL